MCVVSADALRAVSPMTPTPAATTAAAPTAVRTLTLTPRSPHQERGEEVDREDMGLSREMGWRDAAGHRSCRHTDGGAEPFSAFRERGSPELQNPAENG